MLALLTRKCRHITTLSAILLNSKLLHFWEEASVTITTVTSREFNQDVSKIKKASLKGPVFITDRGHPAHVLLTIQDYEKLAEIKESIVDLLAMPDAADVHFEPAKLNKEIYRPEDFD